MRLSGKKTPPPWPFFQPFSFLAGMFLLASSVYAGVNPESYGGSEPSLEGGSPDYPPREVRRVPYSQDLPLPENRSTSASKQKRELIEIQAFPGFDNRLFRFRDQTWTPLFVRVYNHSDKPIEGRVVAGCLDDATYEWSNSQNTFEERIQVPAFSYRDQRMVIYPSKQGSHLIVSLEPIDGRDPAAPRFFSGGAQVMENNSSQHFVVLSKDPSDATSHLVLNRVFTTGQIFVSHPYPRTMPVTWRAYEGVDWVILASKSFLNEMSLEQKQALRTYVEMGGHLLVECQEPDEGMALLGDPFVREMLRVLPGDTVALLGEPLATGAGRIPALVPKCMGPCPDEVPGQSFNHEADFVAPNGTSVRKPFLLNIHRRWGLGTVSYCGFSLDRIPKPSPNAGTPASLACLTPLFTPTLPGQGVFLPSPEGMAFRDSLPALLQSFASSAVPTHGNVLLFLLAYCLLIGPGGYLILRFVRRVGLVWGVFLPLAILIFGYVASVKVSRSRPSTPLLFETQVIESPRDARGSLLHSYVSLYSPHAANYKIPAANVDTTLSWLDRTVSRGLERPPLAYHENETLLIDPLPMFAQSSVHLHTVRRIQGSMVVHFPDPTQSSNSSVNFTVWNSLQSPIKGFFIGHKGVFHRGGPIAPRQSIDLDWKNWSRGPPLSRLILDELGIHAERGRLLSNLIDRVESRAESSGSWIAMGYCLNGSESAVGVIESKEGSLAGDRLSLVFTVFNASLQESRTIDP